MTRKISRKGMIKKLDDLCRDIIRDRDEHTCQWCKRKVFGANSHVSHVIPKSKGYALRWDLQNLKVLCHYCHLHRWHKESEGRKWFDSEFPERAQYLEEHRNDLVPSKEREQFLEGKLNELKERHSMLES